MYIALNLPGQIQTAKKRHNPSVIIYNVMV